MSRVLWTILTRDLALFLGGGRQGSAALPVLFFLAVAVILPLGIGPRPEVLAEAGPGIAWVAALLAAILPLDRLIEPDLESGFFDQLALRGIAEEATMATRIVSHWLTFAPPLLIATPIAAALLAVPGETLLVLELGLLFGTPGLAALGVTVAALTAGLRGGAALSGLMILPLAIPLLIFGAGAVRVGGESGLALTAAISLALCAIAPFAAGAALRAGRE